MPTISISRRQRSFSVNNMLLRLWLYCSYSVQVSELPAALRNQVKNICLAEGRDINQVHLVRTGRNTFAVKEGNQRTYWDLFINWLVID